MCGGACIASTATQRCRVRSVNPSSPPPACCRFCLPQGKAQRGLLYSLTVPDLKKWLKAHGLTVGGAKAELIARIEDKLSSGS